MRRSTYYTYSEDKIEPYDRTQNSNYHDLYAYSKAFQVPPLQAPMSAQSMYSGRYGQMLMSKQCNCTTRCTCGLREEQTQFFENAKAQCSCQGRCQCGLQDLEKMYMEAQAGCDCVGRCACGKKDYLAMRME